MQMSLTGLFAVSALVFLVDARPDSRYPRQQVRDQYLDYNPSFPVGTGIDLRITWEGLTCAIGGSPCDFVQKYMYKLSHQDTEWREFKPRFPVSVYRYGKDCEFIIRELPPNTALIRIQLMDGEYDILADTGPLDPEYQTVIHPFSDRC